MPLAQLAGRPGITVPEGLTAAAASGVPTLAELRDSFPDAAHEAIRASIMASAGDGVVARSRAFLEAQVASRSLTPQPGMAPDAVLSRMEDRLRQDDLAGALAEAAQLPSEASAAMGELARRRAAPPRGRAGAGRARIRASGHATEGRRAMLWSILKILLFLGLAAALAFGAASILETPGEVKIAFGGREFFVSPIGFIIEPRRCSSSWRSCVLKLIGFLVALFRFLLGDETAISRYFSRSRERRGFDALSDGMVALASGDAKTAMKKAQRAERLLAPPRPHPASHRPGGRAERRPGEDLRRLQGDAARRPHPAGRRCRG